MYAAYLYILRAFEVAARSRPAKSPDPEREIAAGRWPLAECCSQPHREPRRLARDLPPPPPIIDSVVGIADGTRIPQPIDTSQHPMPAVGD
jgi:hypothetical protein